MDYLRCKVCEIMIEDVPIVKSFCSKKCYLIDYRRGKGLAFMTHKSNCVQCNKEFTKRRKNHKTCSPECIRKYNNAMTVSKKNSASIEGLSDVPECLICSHKSRALHSHILNKHSMSTDEYKRMYGVSDKDLYHDSYLKQLSDAITGEKNPAYNHDGTLSPYSHKFIKYSNMTDDEKREVISSLYKTKSSNTPEYARNTSIDFFINKGFDMETAKEMLKKRQCTFSKEKCIETHGVDIGMKIFNDRQYRWQKSLYGAGNERKHEIDKKKYAGKGSSSKPAINLFKSLLEHNTFVDKEEVIFFNDGIGRGEKVIEIDNKWLKLDFVDESCKKVIEFYGDFWHGNPNRPEFADDILHSISKKSYKTIRYEDSIREEKIRSKGYSLLVIWESEYKNDKKGTLDKCIKYLGY